MVKCLEFRKEHLKDLDLRHREATILRLNGEFELNLDHLGEYVDLVTVMDELTGNVLTVGGTLPIFPGVADIFMFPSKHVPRHRKEFSKTVKGLVDIWANAFNRLQSVCLNDGLHNRWMRFIGFQKEGVLKAFGPDCKEYALFSRIGG